jgi:predicted TPR repeat methyltransferase
MLDEARKLAVYDELLEADLAAALTSRRARYDVVTAADVLVYVGALVPVLRAVSAALRPSGLAAITVEHGEGEGVRLTASGRYQHGAAHVREAATCAGLTEVSVETVVLRTERGRPVAGQVWVLAKDRG